MVRKAKLQIPELHHPKSEVAAAGQEAAEQAKRVPPSHGNSEVEWNSRETHVVKGNQYASDGWVHGPAQIELMASAYHKLAKLGDVQGDDVRHVTKVRVGRVKGSKTIRIRPTTDTDPDGIELKKIGSDRWINAIAVLGPAKLTVPTGYRERFTVTEAPDEVSAVPALQFNMGKLIERRVISRKKAAQTTDGTTAAATATAQKTPKAAAQQAPADALKEAHGRPADNTSKSELNETPG